MNMLSAIRMIRLCAISIGTFSRSIHRAVWAGIEFWADDRPSVNRPSVNYYLTKSAVAPVEEGKSKCPINRLGQVPAKSCVSVSCPVGTKGKLLKILFHGNSNGAANDRVYPI